MKISPEINQRQTPKLDGTASMQPMTYEASNGLQESLLQSQTRPKSLDLENDHKPKSKPTIRQSKIRYLVLAMAVLLMFGNNYSFDNPQALQKQIQKDVQLTSPMYNLLYSAFSFPNIFLTLLGGFMIDYLGVRVGIFVFTLGVLLAQTVVALGGYLKIFWVMVLGRAFFGIASENLIISQSAVVSVWFRGNELSTAIGIIMTVPEIASAFNSFLSPWIYQETGGLVYPLSVSVIICFFSLICAIILIVLDRRADKEEELLDLIEEGEEKNEEAVSFKDFKDFKATFWILLLIGMLTLGIYIPFLDDANDFYQEKFKFSSIQAGRVLIIPYLVSAFSSPFIGNYVDKVGKRRLFIIITCSLFTLSCILFAVLPEGEIEGEILSPNWWSCIPLVLLGLSFSAYSCVIIPSIQYVVEQRIMGTAFGLLGSLESVALATFPLVAGSIVESSSEKVDGYTRVGFFYAGMSVLGLILSFSLYFLDKKGSMILDFVNPEEPTPEEASKLEDHSESDSSGSDDEDEDESILDIPKENSSDKNSKISSLSRGSNLRKSIKSSRKKGNKKNDLPKKI